MIEVRVGEGEGGARGPFRSPLARRHIEDAGPQALEAIHAVARVSLIPPTKLRIRTTYLDLRDLSKGSVS